MSVRFNADEVFEIAEQIERNGAAFYRKAAAVFSESSVKTLLLRLAVMEDLHEKAFAAMRTRIVGADAQYTLFDPDNQAALYLQAVAEGKVFDLDEDPEELFDLDVTIEDVLFEAIAIEKDSIVFYTGIRELIPRETDKKAVTDIIMQEMGHVNDLLNELDVVMRDME